MRDVKSQVYFEQMKGRGTRTVDPTELRAVTPDAAHKTHFVLVDAVGVTESDKTDSRPLDRKPGVPLDKLMLQVTAGARDTDTLSSLTSRLARLDRMLDGAARTRLQADTGHSLSELANHLLDALDPDKAEERARVTTGRDDPPQEAIRQAAATLADEGCAPFYDPRLREVLAELSRQTEQVIDTVTKDEVTYTGYDFEKAKQMVGRFREFIEANKDELTALQILYNRPYGQRYLTYEAVRELAEAVQRPPYHLAPAALWHAYEQLERSRVRRAGPQRLLTDLVALVRFATGKAEVLEPFSETVNRRFEEWVAKQQASGRTCTPEQVEWLKMIRDHVANSAAIETKDFDLPPFSHKGGVYKALKLFPNIKQLLEELNGVLAA
jgi:type I restriction enzyme R subunit